MNLKDKLRIWIRKRLNARGYGARVHLAKYLNLTPMQISHMLSTKIGRKNRNIQAEEMLLIMRFFGIKVDDPFLSLENDAPAAPPITAAGGDLERAALLHIYDSAKPKQRDAIMKLVRVLAETYNIPH